MEAQRKVKFKLQIEIVGLDLLETIRNSIDRCTAADRSSHVNSSWVRRAGQSQTGNQFSQPESKQCS
jgi:hypothetical protein